MSDLTDILNEVDIGYFLDREGIKHKEVSGSSGRQYNIKECPVCNGNKWKVYLNTETGVGNCFSGSCESKFTKWTFVKAYTGLDKRELFLYFKELAEEIGWSPKRKTSIEVSYDHAELVMPESYEIPIDGRNISYLANRGIHGDCARYFNLRYCEAGAFFYRDGSSVRFQDYSSRVVIPIFDLAANLVSFQGRDVTGRAERKYLFPPGYAATGRYLYNGHNAIGLERAVVGEGVFDVMAIKLACDDDVDFRQHAALGTFGKHLSHGGKDDQISQFLQLKERGLREVTFCWDGEPTAIKDAIKSALLLSKFGFITRVAILPPDKDPNEITGYELRRALSNAERINKLSATRLLLKHAA